MKIIYYDRWALRDAEDNPQRMFIFGDNLIRIGTGGQACIRHSSTKNTFGIPTKKYPGMTYPNDFFIDEEYSENCRHILSAFESLPLDNYKELALPKNGLGTGLARMPEYCPKTFDFLNKCMRRLKKYAKE